MPSSLSRIVRDDDRDLTDAGFQSRLYAHCKMELSDFFLTHQAVLMLAKRNKHKYVGGSDLASRGRAPGAAADH